MRKDRLYIQMFSIHGLLRFEDMQLGCDADTGGQIKYVIELARELSMRGEIERIDLFTRLISDKTVSEDYSRQIERVSDKFNIIRIQCGGKKYIRKELLWPHLDEYVDKTIKFIKRENNIPDIIHGHYADGGYVALQLSEFFGIPFIFTGHSLGRSKIEKLLNDGMKEEDINKKYKINYRISVEEDILREADLVITSTSQEAEEQYGLYHNKSVPGFSVIPPGLDIGRFYPYYHDILPEANKDELAMRAYASVLEELNRFFIHPEKPLILTICRPDKRKNISGLIKACGEDKELQTMANLAIFAGIRKDISDKEDEERDVLTEMLLLLDKYDLYGKMAIPKQHDFEYQVPALYRIAADKKGVFVNAALTEPFGLTIIEASACGLPIVVTSDGGPRDIVKNCNNGILVDTTNTKELSSAIKKIITDQSKWERFSKHGIANVRKHYTWKAHVEKYLNEAAKLTKESGANDFAPAIPRDPIGRRLAKLSYFLITDIDNTLIGEENTFLKELNAIFRDNSEYIGFGIATGRTIDSAVKHLQRYEIKTPDIIISSVGAEIYYGKAHLYGKGWDTHISSKWDREKIKGLVDGIDFVAYQDEETQRKYKISYYMEPGKDRLAMIHDLLLKNRCRYNLIYSHDQFLDILPYRASKGKAIR